MAEFPRVGFFSKGYDCGQVDAFFEDARRAYEGGLPPEQFSAEQVRLATFELKNRGYNIEAVDAAMTAPIPWPQRARPRGTTVSLTARRPCIRASSAPAVSVSPTRAAGAATTARPWMICSIASPPTSTRRGS